MSALSKIKYKNWLNVIKWNKFFKKYINIYFIVNFSKKKLTRKKKEKSKSKQNNAKILNHSLTKRSRSLSYLFLTQATNISAYLTATNIKINLNFWR